MGKFLAAVLLTFSSSVFATNNVGFFFCEFERDKNNQWVDIVSFRDAAMYSLADGELQQQMYTIDNSSGGYQVGYCLNATGSKGNSVVLEATLAMGERIDGFMFDCEPYGINAEVTSTQTQGLLPGESMDILDDRFRHNIYFALPRDFKGDVDGNFAAHCEALKQVPFL